MASQWDLSGIDGKSRRTVPPPFVDVGYEVVECKFDSSVKPGQIVKNRITKSFVVKDAIRVVSQ